MLNHLSLMKLWNIWMFDIHSNAGSEFKWFLWTASGRFCFSEANKRTNLNSEIACEYFARQNIPHSVVWVVFFSALMVTTMHKQIWSHEKYIAIKIYGHTFTVGVQDKDDDDGTGLVAVKTKRMLAIWLSDWKRSLLWHCIQLCWKRNTTRERERKRPRPNEIQSTRWAAKRCATFRI